ncbi:MAG TPA: PTS sugar transporter subunit IIA [Fibrobacteria bacterium]|nr:PTS sugar transporter subunit IIA [Fibrobacteria bacterium]
MSSKRISRWTDWNRDPIRMTDKAASFLQMIRRDRRGRLKVYLGYAAGVGKTYLMLQEAHRLKAEGIDVVIGIVESHGRKETAELIEGLERIPMRVSEYHGIAVEEMDPEAILARRPKVVLVDELAHTNAPGSRNGKRYQDVEDLLAAGINVIATLNVQHLESLYDTVERTTRVKVRERLPDAVLAEADQIVNVDLSPEDLQKRLQEGKVYPMERVPVALANFFQSSHLEQLRELTLREAASQIDFRRREMAGDQGKGTIDQVMVCMDARGPENAALLRYGSRLAGRLNRNWYAVYVQTLDEEPTAIDAARQRRLADTLTLANQLGATVFTLKGENVAETLSRFAREYRVGHVLIGKPHARPWWRRFRSQDVAGKLLRNEGPFNLIVINNRPVAAGKEGEEIRQTSSSPPGGKGADKIRLTDFLEPDRILIWDEPLTKFQAMKALVRTLKGESGFTGEVLLEKLLERENQGSTFLNEGVALPHARMEGLDAPMVALGICRNGILDAFTEMPIEAVFLLFTPKEGHRSHLQLLAVTGRLMQNRPLRNRLRQESAPAGIFEILKESENP